MLISSGDGWCQLNQSSDRNYRYGVYRNLHNIIRSSSPNRPENTIVAASSIISQSILNKDTQQISIKHYIIFICQPQNCLIKRALPHQSPPLLFVTQKERQYRVLGVHPLDTCICYFNYYKNQQMINQKPMFSRPAERPESSGHRVRMNSKYLQSLKIKLLYQSSKISALKYTGIQRQYQNNSEHARRRNRSNDNLRRRNPMLDSMLEKKDRKGSEANTMIQLYLTSKQQALHRNKSQLLKLQQLLPRQDYQRKMLYNFQGRAPYDENIAYHNSFNQQHPNDALKNTTSTVTSSPILLKTIQKIKNIAQAGELGRHSNGSREARRLKIKDFQMIRYVEEGQFGAVYLARHIATNFICAIKKIPKSIFGGKKKYINQLIREVKIQSFLQHPHIIRLYACFDDYANVYLMMEYCSGGNLYATLKKQIRFGEQKVRKYLKQICHAVEYMHDHDIIHRDIKPQNILLHNGMAKICDFGWSINSPLLRETHCGTPLYSSPQMIERKQYDSKVDIWNIGVMTYEFLYGRVPFQIRCEQDLIKIVEDDIYFSKHHSVTATAKDFILKCLKKNPKQRSPINKLLDHQFFHE